MPPIDSVREAGFFAAFQKPSPNPAATVLTEVEPSRSAAPTRSAPQDALLYCWSARPSSPRSVVTVPGLSASSAGGGERGQLVHGLDARGAVPGRPPGRVEPLAGRVQPRRHGLGGRLVVLDRLPQQQERVVEALLHHARAVLAHLAAVAGALAGGQRARGAPRELGERVVEAVGAQLVAGAVRGAALDPVAPALHRPVDDHRRLAGPHRSGQSLRRDHLLEVAAVRDLDDVPVVQVEELHRRPLHVVARLAVLAAHAVRVDRGLVPVHVEDDVVERGGAGGGERLGHAARGEAALALDHVDARGLRPVVLARRQGEADRARDPDPRGAGRELDERCRRRRVPVEGLRAELPEERRRARRVAAEAEQVLEAQALARVLRQEVRVADAGELVAQRPHRVEAHRLVTRRVGDDVGVGAVGLRELVVHRVEEDPGHEAPGGDRAPGVARHRHVVVEERAQRAVEEVDRLEAGQLLRRERRRDVRHLDPLGTPRSESDGHGSSSCGAGRQRPRPIVTLRTGRGAVRSMSQTAHPRC